MSNDNKTLADAQPGGRVRLGDGPTIEKRARELLAAQFNPEGREQFERGQAVVVTTAGALNAITAALSAQPSPVGQHVLATVEELAELNRACSALDPDYKGPTDAAVQAVIAALAAQPSPAGQGDALQLANEWRHVFSGDGHDMAGANKNTIRRFIQAIEALAARQPVGERPMEMRICELRHVSLKPNRPYVFTVDANCANCRADAAYAMGHADAAPAQAVDPADPWRGLYSPHLMPKLDGINQYHVAHPDLPEWPKAEDEERGIGPLVTAQGFAMAVVFGEYPDDDSEEVDYCAWLASWTPDAPAGADWRLVCIQDTEDGPTAFYVRPLALIDSQAVGNG